MKLSEDKVNEILRLKGQGLSSRQIATILEVSKTAVNQWVARRCNTESIPEKAPKILLLDLENAASVGLVFGRFKQNLSQDHILEEGGWLLSYAYKWLGSARVQGVVLTKDEAIKSDDSRLVAELWELIEQADFVVAHNSYGHDIPLLKARVIINGFPPLRKNKIVDSLSLAKEFKFNSKKLDSLCHALGIGRKIEHSGIKLWKECQEGIEKALATMLEYNIGDVELLEELYLTIRPHSTRHPNIALHYQGDKVRCNICCSDNVQTTGNLVTTNVNVFEEYICLDCKARFKSRKSVLNKEQRANVLSN